MKQVLTGYLAYYAVPTNDRTLSAFRCQIIDLWRRSLQRRSQKDRTTWQRITKLVNDFLPKVRTLHPRPEQRFAVKHPRWEPSARIEQLQHRNIEAIIPLRAGTTGYPEHDREKYKWRHLVENFFCRLKAFRRIATRYEKTDKCFAAMINLVAAILRIK